MRLTESIRQRQREGLLPVLSEIKVRSPKDGDLLRGRTPEALARVMGSCAIAGLSVVTELREFGGGLALIPRVLPHITVPVLRKDFVGGIEDIEATAAVGAACMLLTVCKLSDAQLAGFHEAAHRLGLETLVETHSAEEMARVVRLGITPDILGINNRDIQVLETDHGDVSLTEHLAAHAPPGSLLLSESSIRGPEDARRARDAGADAVLVGTSILLAHDPAQAIGALLAVGWR